MDGQSPARSPARPADALGRVGGIQRYVAICQDLAIREFRARYRGNLAGLLGVLIVPIAFLATYSFVFSTIIPIRLGEDGTTLDYAFFLFVGLLAWNLFGDSVGRSTSAFANGAQLVRAPGFPASSLAVVPCVAGFYQSLVWLVAFAVARLAVGEAPPPSLVLAPLVLGLVALLAVGFSLVLATVGVFFRDLAELVGPALTLTMFLSPVLYPADRIAAISPGLVTWNPIAALIVTLRGVMLPDQRLDADMVAIGVVWAVAAILLALPVYRRARGILGDLH